MGNITNDLHKAANFGRSMIGKQSGFVIQRLTLTRWAEASNM